MSLRIDGIVNMAENCMCAADIGTDHGFIAIELVKRKKCKKVIATDINIGPLKKAEKNIKKEKLENKFELRRGAGLNPLNVEEVQEIFICGMGGNLIRDIILERIDIFKSVKCAILQPVQNPEVLRKFIYENGFKIIDEDLIKEDGIYYEIIKISYDGDASKVDPVFYTISKVLLEKKHPLLGEYINNKIDKLMEVSSAIKACTVSAIKRKTDLETEIKKYRELLKCL